MSTDSIYCRIRSAPILSMKRIKCVLSKRQQNIRILSTALHCTVPTLSPHPPPDRLPRRSPPPEGHRDSPFPKMPNPPAPLGTRPLPFLRRHTSAQTPSANTSNRTFSRSAR